MANKSSALLIYGLVGATLAIAIPLWDYWRTTLKSHSAVDLIRFDGRLLLLTTAPAVLVLGLLYPLQAWPFIVASAMASGVVAVFQSERRLVDGIAMFLALLISGQLPWWLRDGTPLSLSVFQSIIVPALTAGAFWMLTRNSGASNGNTATKWLTAAYAVFGASVCFLVLSTGVSRTMQTAIEWHHWSAYIGPAQMIAAGALPLRDIPLQYGLGPSLILAKGCIIGNCWETMYWTAGLTTIVQTFLIAHIVLKLGRFRNPASVVIVLIITLAACLLWTAYPPDLLPTLAVPSTSGMRFLPGTVLLTWIVDRIMRHDPMTTSAKWGHLLWLACIFWSPEAGFQATTIWAPYFFWTRTLQCGSDHLVSRGISAAVTLALVLASGVAAFAIGYRLAFGEWPLLEEYIVYALHPPGPMPINPRGTVLFAVACLASWLLGWVWIRNTDAKDDVRRASWVIVLFAFATFSYYLGRSHDNNILNLLPYLMLLLVAIRSVTTLSPVRTFSAGLIAAIVGWIPTFGISHFNEAWAKGSLFEFAPRLLVASFDRESARGLFYIRPQALGLNALPEEAIPALKYIRETVGESVEIFDLFFLVDGAEHHPPWNALHGPENYVFIPSELRRTYLERVARRFQRPGWVLYDTHWDTASYLSDYDTVYNRDREVEFGSYKAIRYIPKNEPDEDHPR